VGQSQANDTEQPTSFTTIDRHSQKTKAATAEQKCSPPNNVFAFFIFQKSRF